MLQYQYAYVNLERLEDFIKRFRRQRASPEPAKLKLKAATLHDEPSISIEGDEQAPPEPPEGKQNWFFNSAVNIID